MNDEFLHRLRKDPSAEFAAQLRAKLRRESASPRRAPAWVRTLITLLLLGGTAFAITTVALRGLPTPLVELSRRVIARNVSPPVTTTAHEARHDRSHGGVWRSVAEQDSGPGATPRGGAVDVANSVMSPPGVPESTGGVPSAPPDVGGAAVGSQPPEIAVLASWAAYPYAEAIVESVNRFRGGAYVEPVSVRDSNGWPGPICNGGERGPDVAYAFEPIGTVSPRPCPRDASGRSPVVAIPVGYEAVILARSPANGELDLTQRDVFLALAKWIPDPAQPGSLYENTNTTWLQVDSALPSEPIEFMGPPLSSGAGRSMIELLMERGCNTFYWIAVLKVTDPAEHARICRTVRTDGVYREVSDLSSPSLLAQPSAVGIFGFATRQSAALQVLSISRLDGVEPTFAGIESGAYPGSNGFYLYVNRRRVPNVGFLGPRMLLDPALYPAYIAPPLPQYQAALTEALAP